ncbi:PilZ domain-containing protein [Sphingomonas sp.]|uniref:PilZ domain-containing protein n=1 Tax=Sphingomonas sp. TaxID=28214 RepID=UPI001B150619|nr:PilZ domain-containing protein [Sphingomonas sp.]MBO9712813.1 PilZ domain-containing protein [Sphingomonas sp.]
MREGIASTTIFSLCADSPTALPAGLDPESEALDAGWLAADGQRIACQVRRLSAKGALLRVDETVEVDAAFELELPNGQSIPGTISWVVEDDAGFLFAEPIDIVATLARNLAILPAERRRVPRVELQQVVGVRRGGEFEFARTRDLSQAGVGLETSLKLEEGDQVQVAFDGLSTLSGTVKWAQAGKAGIQFDAEIAWQTLMPWLRIAARSNGGRGGRMRAVDDAPRFSFGSEKQVIRLSAAARVREGTRWWNVEVRHLTAHLVEFDCVTPIARGTPLWLWLPGFPGWPANVVEVEGHHYLAEFRVPLRKHDIDRLLPARMAARGG